MSDINCRHLPSVQSESLVGMISLRDVMPVDGDITHQRANFLSELVTLSSDHEA